MRWRARGGRGGAGGAGFELGFVGGRRRVLEAGVVLVGEDLELKAPLDAVVSGGPARQPGNDGEGLWPWLRSEVLQRALGNVRETAS